MCKKLEEFIEKAREVHGDRYDYSLAVYKGYRVNLEIVCKIHGSFFQRKDNHIKNKGCRKCVFDSYKSNTADFIKISNLVHDNFYSYGKSIYKGSFEKVIITCPQHGDFEQTPNNHKTGEKCSKCAFTNRIGLITKTNEDFIKQCKILYGEKYNYDKVNYKGSFNKVTITCKKHGDFIKNPNNFLEGKDCNKCKLNRRRKKIQKKFKKVAKEVHGNKYNYDKVKYKKSHKKVKILCKEHGLFNQVIGSHLMGSGCPDCGDLKKIANLRHSQEKVIEKANKVHNYKYDYSKVNYEYSGAKCTIICKEHGDFQQTFANHLRKKGCPKCAGKHMKIPKHLKKLNKKGRGRIRTSYVKQNYTKNSLCYKLLGCKWKEFKTHLEDNPYGFKVGQEGLDLDHIIPVSKADTLEELIDLFHYKNYQLMPFVYNRFIKNNRPFNKEHFKNWVNEYH